MITSSEATDTQFVERYGITPRSFVRDCLRPSLLAVRTVSCFYRGALVETHKFPAWQTRLRALRIVFAIGDADELEATRVKIPLGALGPKQLRTILDGFVDSHGDWLNTDFVVRTCLKPALDAMFTTLLFYQGRSVDLLRNMEINAQFGAGEIVLRMHRLYRNECDNIHFASYRDIALLVSEAQRRTRRLHIVRKTQLVELR